MTKVYIHLKLVIVLLPSITSLEYDWSTRPAYARCVLLPSITSLEYDIIVNMNLHLYVLLPSITSLEYDKIVRKMSY